MVQLYLRDNVSSVVTPPIQLKNFEKVNIKKEESEIVDFTLTHNDFALFNSDMQRVVEPGEFTVMIGSSSNEIKLKGSFLIDNKK